ncbi:MAG: glycosyl hydrolase, partial [Bacteroidota bacterium]
MSSKIRRISIGLILLCLGIVLSISAFSLYDIQRKAWGQTISDPPSVLKLKHNQAIPDSLLPLAAPPLTYTQNLSFEDFQSPKTQYRPWTRWWWPGNLVQKSVLVQELKRLDSIGFGGVEIQPIALALGKLTQEENSQVFSVYSDKYYQNIQYLLDFLGDSSEFKIDLSIGAGGQCGGPHINLNDNLQSLFWGESQILGGKVVEISVPRAEIPNSYYINVLLEEEEDRNLLGFHQGALRLIALIGAKPRAGKRSLNPMNLSDQVVLDPDSLFILTDLVDERNQVLWNAPKGYWKIISVYAGPNGERPVHSASTDPGFVANPLDSARIASQLNALFKNEFGRLRYEHNSIRGIFKDDYKLKAERLYSQEIFEFFERERGYELTPYLPTIAVPGADNHLYDALRWPRASMYSLTAIDERIQYDYQKTVSDLLIANSVHNSKIWAESQGYYFRSQAYGLNIDLIKAAGQSSIPELEQNYAGGSKLFLKLISSGAHLYDRPLISAESFAHEQKAYTSSPQKLKVATDKLFLSGVNQLVYHGTPYPWAKDDFGQEAWFPYASPHNQQANYSGNFSPQHRIWPHLGKFNEYVSRCQYLLQQGKPQAEALVYYPFLGFPSTFSQVEGYDEIYFNGDLPPWDELPKKREGLSVPGQGSKAPIPHEAWYKKTATMLEMLENQGINWDWCNDEILQSSRWEDGFWTIGEQKYAYLILSHAPHISYASAKHLDSLANLGAPLVIYGEPPLQQAGFYDFQERDLAIARIMRQRQAGRELDNPADLRNHLQRIRVERPLRYAGNYPFLRYQLRALEDGNFLSFLANQSDEERYFRLQLPSRIKHAYWLDPQNGKIYAADYKPEQDLLGYLPAYGSMFLLCSEQAFFEEDSLNQGSPLPFFLAQSSRTILHELQNWELLVPDIKSSKSGRFERNDSVFFDWREEEQLRYTAEEGRYLAELFLQDTLAGFRYVLDLGELYQTADVYLNTEPLGRLSYRPFVIECTHKIKPGWNAVEIWISPSQRNHFLNQANRGEKEYRQFADQEWSLQAAGLLGP